MLDHQHVGGLWQSWYVYKIMYLKNKNGGYRSSYAVYDIRSFDIKCDGDEATAIIHGDAHVSV